MKLGPGTLAGASLILSTLASGCVVPQQRYDAAMAKLRAETTTRQGVEAELERVKSGVASLEASLRDRQTLLDGRDSELAQARLDLDRLGTQRDDARLLVDQLREELSRVGDHLRAFSSQKAELEAALAEADARVERLDALARQVESKVLVMRDVSLALGDVVTSGRAAVTVVGGKPVVRMPGTAIFTREGEIAPEASPALQRLGESLAARPGARVEVSDATLDGAAPEDRIVRLQRVADVLAARGVPFERISFSVAPAQPSTEPARAALAVASGLATLSPGPAPGVAGKATVPAASAARSDGTAAGKEGPGAAAAWRDGPGSVSFTVELETPTDTAR